jgi:hypothetical protein
VKKDGIIIGYAVVEIYGDDFLLIDPSPYPGPMLFYARTLKSAIFPMIDGEYQNITDEQVKYMMDKIKGEHRI